MTIEDIKDIRIQYSKLAKLVYTWFSDNYNLTDFFIVNWEFDCWKDDIITIVYEDIFRYTHSVNVDFETLLKYDTGGN